ncbi:MAG: EAL domain-containing protein [Alphaproteobacteria bacterium]|nr:EAL domain-containing protein [Alphaproteobacteria bacterium]
MTNDKATIGSIADIITASGHVGYQWDMVTDQIMWFGPWPLLFGTEQSLPPQNALEYSTHVLPSDHHLIFSEPPPRFDHEFRLRGGDGQLLWVQAHGTTDFEQGRPVRQQGLLRVIRKSDEDPQALYNSPDRDPLTGRPNRLCLLSVLDKILSGSRLNCKNSGYMVVGIDKLAFVNEAMGLKTADELICATADRLNDLCPTRALVGRVGGDMFGIVLPDMVKDMDTLSARILASFHDHAISAGAACLHMSVCIGTVELGDTHGDAAEVMIHAEQALHEAHLMGRGNRVAYSESRRRAAQNRAVLNIAEHVKLALKTDQVKLAFQPIIDATTGETAFYEVLSRLFNEDGSPLPAGDFIPVVEQMGLAPDFDKHVLALAIAELEYCETLHLAVNISGLTACLPNWPDYMRSKLENKPDVANRLIIEITETIAVQDIEKIRQLLDTLNNVGCDVALDDFGAGTTSIRHLRDLDFAIMKIDRDLLINVTTNNEQQHLVRMLIAMARGLGLKSVAEGIEDQETAQWLRGEKVDLLQGFELGVPSLERPWRQSKQETTTLCDSLGADETVMPPLDTVLPISLSHCETSLPQT